MRIVARLSFAMFVGSLGLGACSVDGHDELGDAAAEGNEGNASPGDGDGDDGAGEGSGESDSAETRSGDGDGDETLGPCERDIDTCEELQVAFAEATLAIRGCTKHAQCGQPLPDTSCGCRDWVARADADTTCFYELHAEAVDSQCDVGLTSLCDCPGVDGFLCLDGICEWDYTHGG